MNNVLGTFSVEYNQHTSVDYFKYVTVRDQRLRVIVYNNGNWTKEPVQNRILSMVHIIKCAVSNKIKLQNMFVHIDIADVIT